GSAMFLHANLLHLASNMLALFYYGSYVESRLGWLRFGLIYAISGLGSMLGMMRVALLQGKPNLYGVGASGAVMGILGYDAGAGDAALVDSAIGWAIGWAIGGSLNGTQCRRNARWTNPAIADYLSCLTNVDRFLIPQVSVSAHLSGLAIGLVLGSLVGEQA
ncbi:MAG: rhomboid family intramembrane serine protease, partial [Synechococcales cyanobacterium RU_4_20]|nr:rhomboid family intramembrane serine protease [Synechococcales cyanobacterium RU_4_20]